VDLLRVGVRDTEGVGEAVIDGDDPRAVPERELGGLLARREGVVVPRLIGDAGVWTR